MKMIRFAGFLFFIILNITSEAQNLNVMQRSNLTYPGQTCGNICGYVDSLGNEYALVGASAGLSIVNVSDPVAPVKVYQHSGPLNAQAAWQEIKVRGKYAYLVTEAGGGLQVFNLSSLPDTSGIIMHSWTGDGAIAGLLTSAHALHVDGNYIYLYGSNLFSGGAIAADLSDPWNPSYAGKYQVGPGNHAYIHDGYVRNDTMYGAHIYGGYFSVVDFTNKSAPVELANQFSTGNYTNNTWLSTNSRVLYTTDDVSNSFLTSYDISDLSNITELDKIQATPGSGSIVHNTHIINVSGNDYAVTSWYRDGFTIVDAGRPQNLIQVGNYDNYLPSGSGRNGTWGVYPYLPSGNIIASNVEDGLFVYTPVYVRACYLEGNITDSVCGASLSNVHLTINTLSIVDSTNISGDYKTGTAIPGTYSVTFSKSGYVSKTISGLVLSPGVVNSLNVQLAPFNTTSLTGTCTDASTLSPIANVQVNISDPSNTYNFISDAAGAFGSCNVVQATGYDVNYGKWGYITGCASGQTINASNNTQNYSLTKGYYDDFTFNFGWTVSGTAPAGIWTRGIPVGTFNGTVAANPASDDSTDCSNMAFVTGNGGGTAGTDDVDNGTAILTSPVFNLSTYTNPYINYSRWFYNGGGSVTPNDSLSVSMDNGISNVRIDLATATTAGNSSWQKKSFKISDYISPTATMKVIVKTADDIAGHIVEAGFDKFHITEGPDGILENNKNAVFMCASPNPFSYETRISYELRNCKASGATMYVSDVTGRVIKKTALTEVKGEIMISAGLQEGMYFVSIQTGTGFSVPLKIIKVK